MRLLLSILLIALVSFIVTSFLPWWMIAIVCFVVTFLFRFNASKSFLAGFAGIFLLWLVVASLKDVANDHILSSRMAQLFSLSKSFLFLLVGPVVGGIVGGMAGWSGAAAPRNNNDEKTEEMRGRNEEN
jgi:hypothetical protein